LASPLASPAAAVGYLCGLRLSHNGLSAVHGRWLGEALSGRGGRASHLVELEMHGNRLSDEGAVTLLGGLSGGSSSKDDDDEEEEEEEKN